MLKATFIMMVFLLLTACASFDVREDNVSVAEDASEVKRIAILRFDFDRPEKGRIERGKIERPANAGEIVADIFAGHLLGTGLYQIVGKERIEALLQKNNLSQPDLLAVSDWQQIQDVLGVDAIVIGVVSEYGDWRSRLNWGGVAIFTARLVDIPSGSLIWSISANRNLAMTNAAAATHAGAGLVVQELLAKTRR